MRVHPWIAIPVCAATGILFFADLVAQGGSYFKRFTAPQVASNPQIDAAIVLLNSATTTCQFGVFAHEGAGRLNPSVAIGGQTGGFATGSIAPCSGQTIPIEASSTQGFLGAVTFDLLTPACFNAVNVQVQYRLRDDEGKFLELFSYPAGTSIKPGQCAKAAIEVDNDPSDGTQTIPGFALVSVGPLQNTLLCHALRDRNGNLIGQRNCDTYAGEHQAKLLTDIFTDGFESGDVSAWEVCVESPPTTGQSVRVDPLFIDVVTDGGILQFDGNEHQVSRPGCDEDEFNLCLDDRFRVSVDFRESPTGPSRRGKVAAALPDQSGYFYFFNEVEPELLIKVLNGCPQNEHFWVFYGATTNVEYTLRVTDTQSGQTQEYTNPFGTAAPPITDTSAFATCP